MGKIDAKPPAKPYFDRSYKPIRAKNSSQSTIDFRIQAQSFNYYSGNIMKVLQYRNFSRLKDSLMVSKPIFSKPVTDGTLGKMMRNPNPIPHRSSPEPKGQDLDFVNVVHSHLIHSDWAKLESLSMGLTPFRVKHILLKIQKDYVLSLEFFNFVRTQSSAHTLETHSMILHILTKNRKFKSAESILRSLLLSPSIDLPSRLFESVLYSYKLCDSSPCVFDFIFKTYAHLKKFRNATDTFLQMKEYGFLPTIESCNAYLSSLLSLQRADIALAFYKEMQRNRISPNVYTLNMVISAFCCLGRLEKAAEMFSKIECMGLTPTESSYNSLIAGYCNKGLINSALELKISMRKTGLCPNVITFNTLINGFCREGKLQEANKIFVEMKSMNVSPNTVTYNILINWYIRANDSQMGNRLCEEMLKDCVKMDILTYNSLLSGLCKRGKMKKAAYLVKQLETDKLVPNASTFSSLIIGHCVTKNYKCALQTYKSMIKNGFQPNQHTFGMLISTLCKVEDYDGAVQIMKDMIERSLTSELDILSELLVGLCRCQNVKLAVLLCGQMESKNLLPEGFNKVKILSSWRHKENDSEKL